MDKYQINREAVFKKIYKIKLNINNLKLVYYERSKCVDIKGRSDNEMALYRWNKFWIEGAGSYFGINNWAMANKCCFQKGFYPYGEIESR